METRKGDIPETDEELEKMLKKPVKRLSKKTQTIINDVEKIQDYVGKELTSTEEVEQAIEEIIATEATLDQQVQEAKKAYKKSRGKTISPEVAAEIAAEAGLDDNGKKVKPVVLDGNLEVVTNPKTAKALVRAEKQAKEKAAKPVSDHKNQSFVGKSGANYKPTSEWKKPVRVTQEKVQTIMQMKTEGVANAEIATAVDLHTGMIAWILAGKGHRDKSHLPAFQKGEAQAYWKERQAEYQARKA